MSSQPYEGDDDEGGEAGGITLQALLRDALVGARRRIGPEKRMLHLPFPTSDYAASMPVVAGGTGREVRPPKAKVYKGTQFVGCQFYFFI